MQYLARAYWKDRKFEFLKPLRTPVDKAPPGNGAPAGVAAVGGGDAPMAVRREEAVEDGLSQAAR